MTGWGKIDVRKRYKSYMNNMRVDARCSHCLPGAICNARENRTDPPTMSRIARQLGVDGIDSTTPLCVPALTAYGVMVNNLHIYEERAKMIAKGGIVFQFRCSNYSPVPLNVNDTAPSMTPDLSQA